MEDDSRRCICPRKGADGIYDLCCPIHWELAFDDVGPELQFAVLQRVERLREADNE